MKIGKNYKLVMSGLLLSHEGADKLIKTVLFSNIGDREKAILVAGLSGGSIKTVENITKE